MDAKLLEKLRRRLTAKTPLIGGWLRRRALSSLIEDGSTEATIALAEAAMRGLDEVDPLTAARYAPRDSVQRALFYFLTGRWEEYESLDFDHAFLRTAYETGDERLRGRIAQRARRDGRIEWVEIVTGGWRKKRLGEISGEEWESTLAAHLAGGRWEELWRLAQEAPPRWSAQILRRMNGSGWSLSSADEQRECETLIELAMNWKEPDWSSSTCREVELESGSPVHSLAISPDGSLMAIEIEGRTCNGRGNWRLREWSLPSGQLTRTLNGALGVFAYSDKCLVINPGECLLATAGRDDKTIQIVSLTDGRFIKRMEGHPYSITGLAVSPDGRLLVSVSQDMTWQLEETIGTTGIITIPTIFLFVAGVIWSVIDEMKREIINYRVFLRVSLLFWILYLFKGFAERWPLVPKEDCEMRLWRLPEGPLLKTMKVPQQIVSCLAISPDGGMLVSGSINGAVQLWKLPDGRLIKELQGQGVGVSCLAFSPDGQLLVSGDHDGIVRLWSLPDGRLIKTLEGKLDLVTCLAISPDGRVLAGGGDTCVRMWSLPDCKLIKIWDWGQSPDRYYFTDLTFNLDGSILACGCTDGTVRLWTSNLLRLSELPVAEASRSDFDWVQGMLRDGKPAGSERRTLEFMAALMRLRRRFEIEVDEPTRRTGKYDIEIDG